MESTSNDVTTAKDTLEAALGRFEAEHPDVAIAMRTMNLSFAQYLQALSALRGPSSTSGSATA